MSRRASAPAVGVVLLVFVTVALAGTVAAVGIGGPDPGRPAAAAALSLRVDGDAVELRHRGGATLDARDLRVVVRVNGTRLRHQPPVPFFAAPGFRGGPTGPFNAAADPEWTAGESASVRVASTNDPALGPGARVEVAVYAGDRRVARLDATAR